MQESNDKLKLKRKKELIDTFINEPHKIGNSLGYTKLKEIHSKWIKYLFRSQSHTALQAHRDSYKTTSLIVGIIIELLLFPDRTILLVRKTITQSSKVLKAIQSHFEKSKILIEYAKILGYDITNFKGRKWNDYEFNLSIKTNVSVQSSITALGIGSSITGDHYDRIIVDDVIDFTDRKSRAERMRVNDYVQELLNIVNKDGGRLIFNGTPWHVDDSWNVIEKMTKKIRKYDITKTEIISKEAFRIIEDTFTKSMIDANYYLKHTPDDDILFFSPYIDQWQPEKLRPIIGVLDKSFGGGDSTCIWIGAPEFDSDKIQVRAKIWEGRSVVELHKEINNFLVNNQVNKLFTEKNDDKGSFKLTFKDAYTFSNIAEYYEKENKHNKIITYITKHWKNLIFSDDPDTKKALDLVCDYNENSEHDDSPDSLSSLLRIFTRKPKQAGVRIETIKL